MKEPAEDFRSFNDLVGEFLEDPEFAVCYLNEALLDGDMGAVKKCLKFFISNHDTTKAHLDFETVGKIMDGGLEGIEFSEFVKLIHDLGFHVTITNEPPQVAEE